MKKVLALFLKPSYTDNMMNEGMKMIRKFNIFAAKTYKTEQNADVAVTKAGFSDLRYFIIKSEDNRYFPVFVGQEAVQRGVHFHYNIVG